MIHSIEIDADIDIAELKKLFRKKLMTGGAVVKLKCGLTDSDHRIIFNKFIAGLTAHNIHAAVLTELAKEESLSPVLMAQLTTLDIKSISRALLQRSDLHDYLRKEISLGKDDSAKQDAAVLIEVNAISGMSQQELREYLADNSGDSEPELIARLALCKLKNLPEDVREQLSVDTNQEVRFQARYIQQ